jgi:hypothetical protein
MAIPFRVSINGTTGTSVPFIVNQHVAPVNLGVGVYQSGGTGMYVVQHTFDDYWRRDSAGQRMYADVTAFASAARWNNHATLTSLTSTADGNYAFPPLAVRLNVVSAAGTTNFEMVIVPAGIAGN